MRQSLRSGQKKRTEQPKTTRSRCSQRATKPDKSAGECRWESFMTASQSRLRAGNVRSDTARRTYNQCSRSTSFPDTDVGRLTGDTAEGGDASVSTIAPPDTLCLRKTQYLPYTDNTALRRIPRLPSTSPPHTGKMEVRRMPRLPSTSPPSFRRRLKQPRV